MTQVACTLTLSGTLCGHKTWETLRAHLRALGAHLRKDPTNGPSTKRRFLLMDMNDGEMPEDLQAFLHTIGLGYIWEWEGCADFSAGGEIWKPGETTASTMAFVNQAPVLPVADLACPEKTARATAFFLVWQSLRTTPFVYAGTAHAILAVKADA